MQRFLVVVLMGLPLLVSSCGVSSDAVLVPTPVSESGSGAGAAAPTSEPVQDQAEAVAGAGIAEPEGAAGLSLPFEPPDAPGVITTTGVPVVVLGKSPAGLVVTTPCGRSEVIPDAGSALSDITVVLDPGHGGPVDFGAQGPNGLIEAIVNLEVAEATRAVLEARGVSVALTRTADYATNLAVRAEFADSLGAELMVSIHHNAPTYSVSATPGSEVFVQEGSAASRRLGGLVYAAVVDALATFSDEVTWSTAPDAGVMVVLNDRGIDAYGMMRRPMTPTALVELAYISNSTEAELLAGDAYALVAATALADAIELYLASPDNEGRGFQEGRVFNPENAPGEDVCVDPDLG